MVWRQRIVVEISIQSTTVIRYSRMQNTRSPDKISRLSGHRVCGQKTSCISTAISTFRIFDQGITLYFSPLLASYRGGFFPHGLIAPDYIALSSTPYFNSLGLSHKYTQYLGPLLEIFNTRTHIHRRHCRPYRTFLIQKAKKVCGTDI